MKVVYCKDCENWYPAKETNGRTGLCAANYMHEMSGNSLTCRNFEESSGENEYVSKKDYNQD